MCFRIWPLTTTRNITNRFIIIKLNRYGVSINATHWTHNGRFHLFSTVFDNVCSRNIDQLKRFTVLRTENLAFLFYVEFIIAPLNSLNLQVFRFMNIYVRPASWYDIDKKTEPIEFMMDLRIQWNIFGDYIENVSLRYCALFVVRCTIYEN